MQGWKSAFGPAYAVPGWIGEVLEDVSWGNDACPSFTHPSWVDQWDQPLIRVWVDHPDMEQRETQGARFEVSEEANMECLLETEEEEVLRSWLQSRGIDC